MYSYDVLPVPLAIRLVSKGEEEGSNMNDSSGSSSSSGSVDVLHVRVCAYI